VRSPKSQTCHCEPFAVPLAKKARQSVQLTFSTPLVPRSWVKNRESGGHPPDPRQESSPAPLSSFTSLAPQILGDIRIDAEGLRPSARPMPSRERQVCCTRDGHSETPGPPQADTLFGFRIWDFDIGTYPQTIRGRPKAHALVSTSCLLSSTTIEAQSIFIGHLILQRPQVKHVYAKAAPFSGSSLSMAAHTAPMPVKYLSPKWPAVTANTGHS